MAIRKITCLDCGVEVITERTHVKRCKKCQASFTKWNNKSKKKVSNYPESRRVLIEKGRNGKKLVPCLECGKPAEKIGIFYCCTDDHNHTPFRCTTSIEVD